jgi:hypothetical protein
MHLISVLNTMQHHLANMKTNSSLHDYLGVRCKTFVSAFLLAIKVDGFFSHNILSLATRRYPSTTTTHASNACSTSRHGSAAMTYNTRDRRSTRTSAASSTHGHGSCMSSPAVSPSGHGSITASSSGVVARRAQPDGTHGPPSSMGADEDITSCRRFETGGSLSQRVNVAACPSPDGSSAWASAKGGSEVAGDGRERGGNPAAFVFVPRLGRVRLQ